MEHLEGRVAVVTGGASGIGRAMASRFLEEGMTVALADIEPAALEEAAHALSAKGDVLAIAADVTDPKSVDDLAASVKGRFGTFHVVCNNAGVAGHLGLTWETPLEDWRWVLDVNLMGVIHGIRSFVPTLVAQGSGHVVNTASLAAWMGVGGFAPYCATKHAVLAISDALRREFDASQSGVGVSVLCPGLVNTSLMSGARNWPDRLGQRPAVAEDPVSQGILQVLLDGTTGGGVAPGLAADAVVKAIKANVFVVTTHPKEVVSAAEARLDDAKRAATP